jgi:hypothetical protein
LLTCRWNFLHIWYCIFIFSVIRLVLIHGSRWNRYLKYPN